ncbi:fungal-specific transcription factor domain-containing protein [Aspergillus tetrazonus]
MGQPETDDTQLSVSHQTHQPLKRKRFTRSQVACDWCHFNHARCDQAFPCSRCLDKGTPCEFTRGRRKRGRLPKVGTPGTARIEGINSPSHTVSSASEGQGASVTQSVQTPEDPRPAPAHDLGHQDPMHAHDVAILSPGMEDLSPGNIVWPMQEGEKRPSAVESLSPTRSAASPCAGTAALTGGGSSAPLDYMNFAGLADLDAFILAHPAAEPPIATLEPHSSLKYPVLQPLIPFIRAEFTPELACGLLELYFTSAFPTHMHPVCHSIPCYVLRKASFLSRTNYRPSSPALLASMLWVASSDDHALASPLTTHYCRKKTSRLLGSLTLDLLRSSAHTPFDKNGHAAAGGTAGSPAGPDAFRDFALYSSTVSGGVQGFGCSVGSLDDVITCIHVASVLSLNDKNAFDLRWWQAAFTLARELQLNREIESGPSIDSQGACFPHSPAASTPPLDCVCHRSYGSTVLITEEQREERRRVWWLLYMMDRHLALCHNRPLMLLDSESKGLLLPLDEEAWQAGKVHSNSPDFNGPQCVMSGTGSLRRVFSDSTCHDPSLFGFFLPLMTILGQLLDINQARNHPMLGLGVLGERTWETQLHEVLGRLDQYEASLYGFIARCGDRRSPSLADDDTAHCLHVQTRSWLAKTVKAYASYYIDLLHILQNGKWDPRSLAADSTLWASSLNLASAVPHALKAAESVRQVLHFDPNLSFMPAFFSAQLLQGGFYFLVLLEQLQDQAGEPFLSACEAMLRAAESWTVTLNNGYLKGFCLVMRSTVAQARGRPITQYEVRQRRSAIAALHGWSGLTG